MEVKRVRLIGEVINEEVLLDTIASRRIENNCFVTNLGVLVLISEGDEEAGWYWDVFSPVDRTVLRVPMPRKGQWREALIIPLGDRQEVYARFVSETLQPERTWEARQFRFSRVGDRVFVADITPRVVEVPEFEAKGGDGNGNGALRGDIPMHSLR